MCMDMRKLVGRNALRLRRENGLTQEQLAERSGFTQQYISDLERGLCNPTGVDDKVTMLADGNGELAEALGVSHVELVRPE